MRIARKTFHIDNKILLENVRDVFEPIKVHSDMFSEGDCFGRLWSLSAAECTVCANESICGQICANSLKKILLSELRISPISQRAKTSDWMLTLDTALRGCAEPVHISAFLDMVAEVIGISDNKMIGVSAKYFMVEFGYVVIDGYLTLSNEVGGKA